MKTFEFTEQEAELLRKEQYKYLINDNIDHFLLLVQQIVSERITPEPKAMKLTEPKIYDIIRKVNEFERDDKGFKWLGDQLESILTPSAPITPEPASDKLIEAFCEKHAILPETLISVYNDNLERIKSILSTPEPGESGQSAEDVLKGMYGNNTQYGYSFNSTIEAMRLHASQVCADKDREIQRLNDKVQGIQEFMDKRRTQREQLESEIDGLNESLTVMLRENAELEKEVKRFNTMRHDSAFVNNVCLSYRHDFGLVAPKERKLIEFECLEWMRAILNNIEFKPK